MDDDIFNTLSDGTVAITLNYSLNESSIMYIDNFGTNESFDCVNDHTNSTIASPYYQSFVYIMYSAIFVIALGGNGIVCYIVQSTPRMRTVTNYFIMNLAVGDILVTVFCIPFTSIGTMILQYWPFGGLMCSVVNYMQAVSVLVSAYTLVAISFDRYIAIMWPLKPRLSKRYAIIIISGVWLFALITASPVAIVSTLTQPTDEFVWCDRYLCDEKWPDPEYYGYYNVTLLILQFVIPLTVLIFTYTRIALVVWCKRIPGEAENSRDQRIARSKRKMIKMMVTVVIVFICCWLPLNITLVLLTYTALNEFSGLPILWLMCHWLAMSHSCYNPIIYCYMNQRFRMGFLQAVGKLPCCRKYLPADAQRPRSSMAGFALTGIDATENSLLHRVNTCTTYVSMRHKLQNPPCCMCTPPTNGSSSRPASSTSCNNHPNNGYNGNNHHHHHHHHHHHCSTSTRHSNNCERRSINGNSSQTTTARRLMDASCYSEEDQI